MSPIEIQLHKNNNGLIQSGNTWILNVDGVQMLFSYSPEQLQNISNNVAFNMNNYAGKDVYLDIENEGIKQEIISKVGYFSSRVQDACYGNCSSDLPEKRCDSYMIVCRENEENSVRQQENCVFISGDLRAVQSFEYRLFGLL